MQNGKQPHRSLVLSSISVGEYLPLKALAYLREYRHRLENKARSRESSTKYDRKVYALALSVVADGLPECKLEDDSCKGRLEIDHVNGDGAEERSEKASSRFYRDIIDGERKTNDLRVLCSSHNRRKAT